MPVDFGRKIDCISEMGAILALQACGIRRLHGCEGYQSSCLKTPIAHVIHRSSSRLLRGHSYLERGFWWRYASRVMGQASGYRWLCWVRTGSEKGIRGFNLLHRWLATKWENLPGVCKVSHGSNRFSTHVKRPYISSRPAPKHSKIHFVVIAI